MTSDRALVVTHKDCFDGHTAAWIYSRFVDPDAEFLPCRYGDAVPLELARGRRVIVMDFSWKRADMIALILASRSMVVLDHHATAERELDGILDEIQQIGQRQPGDAVVFDMKRSGAGLAWDYYPGQECCASVAARPALVNYVEDRDLWRMALPHAREYMANVYAAPMTFEAWDILHARPLDDMLSRGEAILGYMHQYGTKALAEARLRTLAGGGLAVWTINLPYMNCSDYLSRLMEEKAVDFVMGYFCRNDGRWQFSLRSRNGFDCSAIASAYGGGGHKQAAGFDVADLAMVFGG